MARPQQRFTAQQWAGLIKEQQDCGDSIDVFCARKRVGTSTFTKWRRRFQGEWELPSYEDAKEPRGFVEAVSPSSPDGVTGARQRCPARTTSGAGI